MPPVALKSPIVGSRELKTALQLSVREVLPRVGPRDVVHAARRFTSLLPRTCVSEVHWSPSMSEIRNLTMAHRCRNGRVSLKDTSTCTFRHGGEHFTRRLPDQRRALDSGIVLREL